MDVIDWQPFPKITRWSKGSVIISEKLDGTNASIVIDGTGTKIWAAKRTSILVPGTDNFGFRAWVESHAEELLKLGPGTHFGEWYGAGIQRGYGLTEKRFALFNSFRWQNERPACCDVVPVMGMVSMDDAPLAIATALHTLQERGSIMVPGFMKPEGIVAYVESSGTMYKKLLENDNLHKGEVAKNGG